MNKIITLIILLAFIFVGCQEDNSILEPINDTNVQSLNKGASVSLLHLGTNDEVLDVNDDKKYINTMKKLAKNYTFDGAEGGQIIQKYQWVKGIDSLKLEAYLRIPAGAYEGELTFELVFDPNLLSMELHPTPFYFDKPVVLTMKYKGISENYNVDSENLDFQYHNPDGSFEKVNYQYMDWDPIKRELKVFRAELHHFSRYGWTRSKEVDKREEIFTK